VGGAAAILAAPGKHGKTTLALAFHQRGYRILSEDTTCCRPGSPPEVLPGPTSVRLRPDVFHGEAPAGTRVLAVSPDRIHLVLDPERAGSSRPVPTAGIFFLRGPAADVRLEPLKGAEAMRDLWALGFRLRTPEARRRSFARLGMLAAGVPIWNLHRPISVEALDQVVAGIVNACI
jgi:hypothetical protein